MDPSQPSFAVLLLPLLHLLHLHVIRNQNSNSFSKPVDDIEAEPAERKRRRNEILAKNSPGNPSTSNSAHSH
ncbi:hypothetical protein DL96DRAFT_1642063 [Flagelloscypha sp. PMI_526]|nr:hypothetical protein DL96DRAFT_1642063 [Flagelloscypha sp. PMI_526]